MNYEATIHMVFSRLLIFWFILGLCECLMPGFVVYYVPMTAGFVLVALLGIVDLLLNKSK
jgi:hypothetical protein